MSLLCSLAAFASQVPFLSFSRPCVLHSDTIFVLAYYYIYIIYIKMLLYILFMFFIGGGVA